MPASNLEHIEPASQIMRTSDSDREDLEQIHTSSNTEQVQALPLFNLMSCDNAKNPLMLLLMPIPRFPLETQPLRGTIWSTWQALCG